MKRQVGSGAVGSVTILPAALTDHQEVDHRVANSLQLISALLSLQAQRSADPAICEALTAAVHRVTAIGAVHRQLCQSGSRDNIDIAAYLADLAVGLEQGGRGNRRQLYVHVEPALVPASFASIVGIVVTELVMNAFKHAYAPGASGDVDICLFFPSASEFWMEVRDYGQAGAGQNAPPRGGLGTDIINAMSHRLEASHRLTRDRFGMRFSMSGRVPTD
ncbi:sensor histidine kinase [Sphingomonas sp. ASY06-1R]|uniref:sensor histidine kinase n=1 Tax=Sphingomonas sp. ASY06-1R TaxID=3445771 RepID=UPI003FA30F0E